MSWKATWTLLILIGLVSNVISAFEVEDPKQSGVKFIDKSKTLVDEKNPEPDVTCRVKVALITHIDENAELHVTPVGLNPNYTVVEHETDSNSKYLEIDCLDFEALTPPLSPRLMFDIYTSSVSNRKTVTIEIVNLDDEPPDLLVTKNCNMNENQTVDASQSNCSFTIRDPDGFLDNMIFIISKDYADIFDIVYKNTPAHTGVTESPVYLVLKEGQILDFEEQNLHIFQAFANDSGGNESPVADIVVKVNDMPDMPPIWKTFKSAYTIDEEKPFTFTVSAEDGDYGIRNPINYKLDVKENLASIDTTTGLVSVQAIDRDQGEHDEVVITITAYDVKDEMSFISDTATLYIQDIDDNNPKINVDGKSIEKTIDEGASDVGIEFNVNDIDMGKNAMYDVTLKLQDEKVDYSQAFAVVPKVGFEETDVILSVIDSKKLDYEDPQWQIIKLTVQTIGPEPNKLNDALSITINLNDINDEVPIFKNDGSFEVSVPENVTKGYCLFKDIKAEDKDQEDIDKGVKHQLVGTLAQRILTIDPKGGDVNVADDNVFDYEKQTEVNIQITATDNAQPKAHTATAQLLIHVTDVNDENPRLSVKSDIEIEENTADGTVIKTDITATDDDSLPYMTFSIDWDNSYVTKNSRTPDSIPNFKIIECITVREANNNKTVTAKFTLKETVKDNTPDFEVYDTLYLLLKVTDENTEVAGREDDSALITIRILDINDNIPKFKDVDVNEKLQVAEDAKPKTLITTVVATDDDIGEKIVYGIAPSDENTPDWLDIDLNTGFITVKEDAEIDCDKPPREYINYTVTATDPDPTHVARKQIAIFIIDANDEKPKMGPTYIVSTKEEEKDTPAGTVLIKLTYTDKDRESPNNLVKCQFRTGQAPLPFQINDDNEIIVDLSNGKRLDRETIPQYDFELNCYDNPPGTVHNNVDPAPKITITLEDINDNVPYIKNKEITGLNENMAKGPISTVLEFDDIDEGKNALINPDSVKIYKIERFINRDDGTPQPDTPQDLFTLSLNDDSKTAILNINRENLVDCFGYIKLHIKFEDQGTYPGPLGNDEIVTIEILKFNFKAPSFKNFKNDDVIYLQKEQTAYRTLKLYNGDDLKPFTASDGQNNKFTLNYTLAEDESKLFTLSLTTGVLQLINVDKQEKHKITIRAAYVDADETLKSADISTDLVITIDYFDKTLTDPIFDVNKDTKNFFENQTDELQTYQLPKASYSQANLPPEVSDSVYYLLMDTIDGTFELDKKSGILTLKQELDYETRKTYDLAIRSSNSENLKDNAQEETKFSLSIVVIDVNDNPPVFAEKTYITTLLVSDKTTDKSVVQQVQATDLDDTSVGKLCYKIDSWDASNAELKSLPDPFSIEEKTGNIKPKFSPKSTMNGYFTLQLSVQDEGDNPNGDCNDEVSDEHKDHTDLVVYLVSTANLIQFIFENTPQEIDSKRDHVKQILEENFVSYSASVQDATDNSDEHTTKVKLPLYFVDNKDQKPVEAENVYKKCADASFFRTLKDAFKPDGLILTMVDGQTTEKQNLEATFKAWFIGTAVILGSFLLLLGMAFFLKTRTLKQRINKLSSTKFGSQESGLNRIGVTAAPTTNKHAVEGSNPVFNNDIDTRKIERRESVNSGDSDLIGVEDDEKFNYDPIERY